jgi:hypothetical protein
MVHSIKILQKVKRWYILAMLIDRETVQWENSEGSFLDSGASRGAEFTPSLYSGQALSRWVR